MFLFSSSVVLRFVSHLHPRHIACRTAPAHMSRNKKNKRSPVFIADNVGDNVGNIAGLFGSFAKATSAVLVLIASSGTVLESTGVSSAPLLSWNCDGNSDTPSPIRDLRTRCRGESIERYSHHQHCTHESTRSGVVVDVFAGSARRDNHASPWVVVCIGDLAGSVVRSPHWLRHGILVS